MLSGSRGLKLRAVSVACAVGCKRGVWRQIAVGLKCE